MTVCERYRHVGCGHTPTKEGFRLVGIDATGAPIYVLLPVTPPDDTDNDTDREATR